MKMLIEKCFTRFLFIAMFLPPLILTLQKIESSNFDDLSSGERLNDLVVHLVTNCFLNKKELITISGNVRGKQLFEKIHDSLSTTVTKMSTERPSLDVDFTLAKNSWSKYAKGNYHRFEYKAQGFVIAATSLPNLRNQFEGLMTSRYWNAAGLFVIINDDVKSSCKDPEKFLRIAWGKNSLSSVFLCRDNDTKEPQIFSYNPFNHMAPKNWIEVSRYPGRHDHPWILFKHNKTNYDGTENCSEIFWDKTKTLNGYQIRFNAIDIPLRLSIDYDEKFGLDKYGGQDGKLMGCVFDWLNASMEGDLSRVLDSVGYLASNGTYTGMLSDQFYGRIDIGLNARYMVELYWKLDKTYPHASAAYCFLIKSRGNVPQWMSLAFVFDPWVSLGLVIVIILTTLVLIYYTNVSQGFLDSLRLFLSSNLVRVPRQFPARLFLTNVILLILIANGIFQGKLVSMLTKPRAFDNPETVKELSETGYTIVGFPAFVAVIDDPELRSRYEPNESKDCVERILNSENIICLQDCQIFKIEPASRTDVIHVVSERAVSFHMNFVTSLDWPLLKRFDEIIQRLREAGLPDYWQEIEERGVNVGQTIESLGRNRLSILSLSDLAFIFQWLLSGLTCATLVFLYEIRSLRYGKIKFRKNYTAFVFRSNK